jgi:hypothetical protein
LDIPPVDIRFPATMKKGIANKIKESAAFTALCSTATMGIPPYHNAIIEEMNKANPTGMLKIKSPKKTANKTALILRHLPSSM